MRAAVLLFLVACDPSVAPITGNPDAGTADSSGTSNDKYRRYTGAAATAGPVDFGGPPYCHYRVSLSAIKLDIVTREDRELARMVVTDTRIEESTMGCMLAPAPPNGQVFEHVGAPVPAASGVFAVTPIGAGTNSPMTALAVRVTGLGDGTPSATATWTRTDQVPPLDWVISTATPIALAPRACTVASLACVGRDAIGQLFVCNSDGLTLTADKLCDAGCNAAGTACQ